ncbi:nematicidal protein 2-like protein (plasmid) [Rahnella aceris]|uniref:Nematicidal protein 2-like protein n=1 Tax=Rahnella sp. (strain Y9602) TaxID=2703885 RepID=A0A0H3FPB4_RAHSY|nr:RHS repeat-associated core domain-containing protein [Rahnella aceris]ADW76673.1 nematicidal protein 2-like protein [Rahnella aceris]
MTFMTAIGATRFIRHGHACLGLSGYAGLTLNATGHNNSPLWSRNPSTGAGQLHTWSPWGSGDTADGIPGFNGERPDPVSGSYHLGNGYRAYNPVLRRFNCPDSLSPFGAGGINPYAYCAGDPVNHTDPTGHISWQGIAGIVGGVIGLGLTLFSAGTSIMAYLSAEAVTGQISALSIVTGIFGAISDSTAIAGGFLEDKTPPLLTEALGWISLATGVMGMGMGCITLNADRAARASAVNAHIREGLSPSERLYYNNFRRRFRMEPDEAAEAARRADREFRYGGRQGRNTRTGPKRRNAPFNGGNTSSRTRPNNNIPRTHYNVARQQVETHLSTAGRELDGYPLIKNIIDNPDRPTNVFPGGLSAHDFKRTYLQIHPDKVPEHIRPYATNATQIFQNWKSQLVNESVI